MDKVKIAAMVDEMRPALQMDGGDMELVEITDDGIVKVQLQGACGSCFMSTITLKQGIEATLKKHFPEVKEVIAV